VHSKETQDLSSYNLAIARVREGQKKSIHNGSTDFEHILDSVLLLFLASRLNRHEHAHFSTNVDAMQHLNIPK
jgi:hypothetical protein